MRTDYNVWTNFETWRVDLEIFDGMDVQMLGFRPSLIDTKTDLADLVVLLKEYAEDILYVPENAASIVHTLVHEFLSEVDWEQIASHLIDDYVYQEVAS